MVEKKQPGRFTLQFNLKDPQQQMVSELLEQQGRHKAGFLTSAVLAYIQHPEQRDYSPMDEEAVEQILLTILQKHPQFVAATPRKPPKEKDAPARPAPTANPWGAPAGDDTMAAIAETLAAFQQG